MQVRRLFETVENPGLKTNIAIAFLAQGVSLLASVVTSLIVPKLLGIEDYAYWQLFLLYSSYCGLLLLGINDGIYLRLGGKKFDSLDFQSLKSEFCASVFVQIMLGVFCIVASVNMCSDGNRIAIWILVVVYGLFANAFSYVGYIFQSTNLTHLYSFACLLNRMVYLLSLVVVLVLGAESHLVLAVLYCVAQGIALAYCFICSRKVLSGGFAPLSSTLKLMLGDVKAGIQIMVAYYASTMILGFSRMVIDMNWDLADFGAFSFSLSIMTFVLAFVGQVSMVLFPALKRQDDADKAENFMTIKALLTIFLPLVYFLYYPICAVLGWWLPEYMHSFIYLGLVLPICVFDSEMNLLNTTFLKIYRKETALMMINVIAMVVSIVLICLAAFLLHRIDFVAISAMVAVALRSFIAETYLRKKCLESNISGTFVAEFSLALVFISCNMISADVAAELLVLAAGYFLYLAINRSSIAIAIGYIRRTK